MSQLTTDFAARREVLMNIQRENLYAFLVRFFFLVEPRYPFKHAPHVEAMCYLLQETLRGGPHRKLIITLPPRYLKTVTTSIMFVAWLLGRDPTKKVMVASYGAELAEKHAEPFRKIIAHPAYQKLFPRLRTSRNNGTEVTTTLGGGRRSISLGGAVTGMGADIIIVDDLLKAGDISSEARRLEQKRFVDETLYSRMDNKKEGIFIVLQQRLHEDDVVQHLLDKGGWHHFSLPAFAEEEQSFPLYQGRSFDRVPGDVLAPDFEDEALLRETERHMTHRPFSAQYQQRPTPPDGDLVRWDWFKSYEVPAERQEYECVVQSWDTASSIEPTAAWSVCMTLGLDQGKWDILDIWRKRVTLPDLLRAAKSQYRKWVPDKILIENKSSGIGLIQSLNEDLGFPGRSLIHSFSPTEPKLERLEARTPQLERGLVKIPPEALWLPEFKRELLAFPNGRYDDQVDAFSQFLYWTGLPFGRSLTNYKPPRRFPRAFKRGGFEHPLDNIRNLW